MKAIFESIAPGSEHSFAYRVWRRANWPFNWHFHPEIELTLIPRGTGRRFVGDDISPFGPGDLVLLGPNLPHTWTSDEESTRKSESIVIQFRRDCLGDTWFDTMPEMSGINRLLHRSARGLQFTGKRRDRVAKAMFAMEHASPVARLTTLLTILDDLAADTTARLLSSEAYRPSLNVAEQKRIHEVCNFLNREFANSVVLEQAAEVAGLSPGGFARFFRKATGKTFTHYLTELRVGRACHLMIHTDQKIASIAYDAGFGNLLNFNRRFIETKKCTPREFRRQHSPGAAA